MICSLSATSLRTSFAYAPFHLRGRTAAGATKHLSRSAALRMCQVTRCSGRGCAPIEGHVTTCPAWDWLRWLVASWVLRLKVKRSISVHPFRNEKKTTGLMIASGKAMSRTFAMLLNEGAVPGPELAVVAVFGSWTWRLYNTSTHRICWVFAHTTQV